MATEPNDDVTKFQAMTDAIAMMAAEVRLLLPDPDPERNDRVANCVERLMEDFELANVLVLITTYRDLLVLEHFRDSLVVLN